MAFDLPHTVEDAVRMLLVLAPGSEHGAVARMDERQLTWLHLGLGSWVRNNMGLWEGNEDLLADTGALDANGASSVIIRSFWQRVRGEAPPRLPWQP